jgi:homoserine kinase
VSLNRANRPSGDDLAVPASVGNIGSGFDTLAVALRLYLRLRVVDVRDDGAATLTVVKSTPPVAGRNAVERAYQAIARWTGLKAPSVFVEAKSDIPMTAGLGSSAAAAVAGLRMFERVTQPLPEGVLLAVATSLEGHADNAAAALHGGLTSVIEREGDEPVALRWQWPEELRFVVATPSVGLSTSKARAALPDSLTRRDAVFNLQRVLSLVHALQSGEYDLLRESVRDRWHQRARAALVPQLGDVLALEDPAILASFLSGAGPSVALVARGDFERLEQLLASTYERAACPVRIRTLAVHQSSDVARETVASAPGRNR